MWEAKLISHKQYENIAIRLDEIGKMFWGWKKSLDHPQRKTALFKNAEKTFFRGRTPTNCQDSIDSQA